MRIAVVAALVWIAGCSPVNNNIGGTDAGTDAGMVLFGQKPQLMFLVDKSGSMNFAMNDQVAPCTPGCNTPGNPACAAGCKTRLQELKTAMATFLPANGSVAWLGLAIFPTAAPGTNGVVDACGPTTATDIRVQLAPHDDDLAAEMNMAAEAVNTEIQAIPVGGGTPTGDSLKFLGTYPPLLFDPTPRPRNNFVLLITDGLPNCNAANANTCTNAAACKCTLIPASACQPASFCAQGCLDSDNSAAQISALRQKGIKTLVVVGRELQRGAFRAATSAGTSRRRRCTAR